MDNYVITIARGFGSGGKAIARELSKRLDIPCYDSQILKMASEYSGINEALFHKADEKLTGHKLLNKLKTTPSTDDIVGPTNKKFTSDLNLFSIQKHIITELAKTQSCIIIGKCANIILEDYSNVLSVYVEATREKCIESVVNLFGNTPEEAEKMIIKTDRYRKDYYEHYTGGKEWTNPTSYDMTLNTGRLGRENSVKLIEQTIHIKFNNI
ncbi:MAG: AAA family ATPase [Lachnospiraceae bacterium]